MKLLLLLAVLPCFHSAKINQLQFQSLSINLTVGPSARWGHAITLSTDQEKVFLFGGSSNLEDQGLNDFWQLNLRTGSWLRFLPGAVSPSNRFLHKIHLWGKFVFLFGGRGINLTTLNDVWAFDLLEATWKLIVDASDMEIRNNIKPQLHSIDSALNFTEQSVVFAASAPTGLQIWKFFLNTTSLNRWRRLDSSLLIPSTRIAHRIAIDIDQIFIHGGYNDLGGIVVLSDLWLFRVSTRRFSRLADCDAATNAACPPARLNHMILVSPHDKKLIIYGGSGEIQSDPKDFVKEPLNDTWEFDIDSQKWNRIDEFAGNTSQDVNSPLARSSQAVSEARDGRVFIHGGMNFKSKTYFGDIWIVDILSKETKKVLKDISLEQNSTMLLALGLGIPIAIFMVSLAYWCFKFRKVVFSSLTTLSPSKESIVGKSLVQISKKTAPMIENTGSHTDFTIAVHSVLSVPGYAQYDMNKDFKYKKVLTEGGFGQIILIKLLNPQLKQKVSSDVAVIKAVRVLCQRDVDSFLQEVALMTLFGRYPQFGQFLGYEPRLYGILMKYYPAGPLSKYRKSCNHWSAKLMTALLSDITQAVAVMHQKGYVHCDLKPQNILIDHSYLMKRECAVLVDFGLTRSVDNANIQIRAWKRPRNFGMTSTYAAPETLQEYRGIRRDTILNDPVIAKAGDVYALACIMYDMLTNRPPWR